MIIPLRITPGVRPCSPMRLLALVGVAAVLAALAACSTTEGFGRDVKDLGGGIEDSAARNK